MSSPVIVAIPSKGRLMEATQALLAGAGLNIEKSGHERGYRGRMVELPEVEVHFLSASEIALGLKTGRLHVGVTGEDLVRETILLADQRVDILQRLNFGHANVVVAVPACWIDVVQVADLEEISGSFEAAHGRRLRLATKYMNLTRRFLGEKRVTSYRIVESLGATEGTPAAGTADLIVDITSSGATLEANGLKQLVDGTILRSQACLFASRAADWHTQASEVRNELVTRLAKVQ